jgi:uncharacterized repeat protein (TIGR01451 family)
MDRHETPRDARVRRPGLLRRTAVRIAVAGLVATGALTLSATTARADSPNPGGAQAGSAVRNPDGSLTVTVDAASWTWNDRSCSFLHHLHKIPGWQVVWGDNDANLLVDAIHVGDANDNRVHIDTALASKVACTDLEDNRSGGTFAGSISHTYSAAFVADNPVAPCVITYDVHEKAIDGTGWHSGVAGGKGHNADNAVETNGDSLEAGCVEVDLPVDVGVDKTGPTTAVVGTSFAYTITARNTGAAPVDDVTVSDVIASGAAFVSATSPCTYDAPATTVTCAIGTLGVDQDASVQIVVVPTAPGVLSNTAVVTPDDETPDDNTSTWVIPAVTPAPAAPAAPVEPVERVEPVRTAQPVRVPATFTG